MIDGRWRKRVVDGVPLPWRKRVVDGVPLPILTRPHELTIAAIILVLGGPALLGVLPGQAAPGNPVPLWLWHGWGFAMTVASVFTVWGVFSNRVKMEWSGQLLAGYGLAFFAAVIGYLGGIGNTYPTVTVFCLMAAVSWWRCFKLSSASYVQYRLTQEARKAHVRAADSREGKHE